jgi:hypothetical protein
MARDLGKRAVLLVASDGVGGQYWRHLPLSRPARDESLLHHGWPTFCGLRVRLEGELFCEIVASAHVWAIRHSKIFVSR